VGVVVVVLVFVSSGELTTEIIFTGGKERNGTDRWESRYRFFACDDPFLGRTQRGMSEGQAAVWRIRTPADNQFALIMDAKKVFRRSRGSENGWLFLLHSAKGLLARSLVCVERECC